MRHGGDIYRETSRYNYSPLWALAVTGAEAVARAAGVSTTAVLGLLLLAGDIATAVLVYRLARRRLSGTAAALSALFFFANPVSILVSSHHLQFDGLAILALLGAILLSERGRDLPAAGALTLSLLIKHVAALHPLLFRRRPGGRGLLPVILPYLGFAAAFLPYLASWREIAQQVLLYRGVTGNYGIEALVLLPGVPDWVPVPIFFAAVGVALYRLRDTELERASLLLFLVVARLRSRLRAPVLRVAGGPGRSLPRRRVLPLQPGRRRVSRGSALPGRAQRRRAPRLVRPLVGRDRLAAVGASRPAG